MTVTASLVKELREQTGVGMMECKKALEETGGDLEQAITLMRKSGQAKAAKKSGRVAAEGTIVIKISDDNKKAIIVEVNCETDFAARDTAFVEFANVITEAGLRNNFSDLKQLLTVALDNGQTVATAKEGLVAKIGENITVRRAKSLDVVDTGMISSYVHGNGKIGVLVAISVEDAELGKDISMHVAAIKPLALLPEELPQDLIEKEKEIYLAQMQDSGKPAEILEKIVAGKVNKFISESALIKQSFVKDPALTIEKLLEQKGAKILGFIRFEVGEGIDKQEVDFAAEVQAQVDSSK